MKISITKMQEEYLASLVDSGEYQNVDEAVQDAISLHQKNREVVIEALRIEIEKGWNSPDSPRNVQDIIAAKASTHND